MALKLDLLIPFIKEPEFDELIIGIGLRFQFHLEFPFPFLQNRIEEAFGQVRINDRVHHQGKVVVRVCNQVVQTLFNLVFQQKGGSDLAGSVANRTNLGRIDIHFRAHTLTGDLQQSEFGNG